MSDAPALRKLETHIPGFDVVAAGGLPLGRTTLVSGTAGSGKTVLASHFLAAGILEGRAPGLFVTFEETPDDIRVNMRGFGWDIAQWEREGLWTFLDASEQPGAEALVGTYELGGLVSRIRESVRRTGAERVAVDSVGALLTRLPNVAAIRSELARLGQVLKELGVTTLFTTERREEYGPVGAHGVEEFVADNVVILRNTLQRETRRRTLEILKFRGTTHQKGEYPMTIVPGRGIVIVALEETELRQRSTDARISSGVPELDQMCAGGFFRASLILVSGSTGAGKTLLTTEFARAGCEAGERVLLVAFEESRDQLGRNARGWNIDLDTYERQGLLRVTCQYPEVMGPEEHLVRIRDLVDDFEPQRVIVDSLSALERVTSMGTLREFVLGLSAFLKDRDITGLLTSTTERLVGPDSVTEGHISTVTDAIILLRYVERSGEIIRTLTVLKMRGSPHDKTIREFTIDSDGLHIGGMLRDAVGVLGGFSLQFPGRASEGGAGT